MPRSIGSIVALLALAWVALLTAAPLLPLPAAGLLYAIGSLICHQIPERSFHLDAFQLPVCARCAGLYAGGAIGSVAAVLLTPWRSMTASRTGSPHATLPAPATGEEAAPYAPYATAPSQVRAPNVTGRAPLDGAPRAQYVVTLLAALPTIVTFALEWGGGWPLSNTARAVAGVPLGLAVAFVVVRAWPTLHYGECALRRPMGHGQPPSTNI